MTSAFITSNEDRLRRLKARMKELPERPGVYLHKNPEAQVIYVGKARNLRSRVSSYLIGRGARDAKTMSLINEIETIDFVTTNNELEAILLENNLIKTHQPRYNVLLRDDKTYPYLKVTISEPYPRVVFTRRVDRSRGDLYFGPFFAGTARRILKIVTDQFKLRSCDLEIPEGKTVLPRPCLYYDMHQCLGPCVAGLTTTEAYREMADDVALFLGGRGRELQSRLKERMYRAATEENFELAGYFRDLIRTTERIQAEQQVASSGDQDVDVWGVFEEEGDVAVQLFIMRNGNLVDRRELFWEKTVGYEGGGFVSEVLQRYYEDNLFIPSEVHLPFAVEEQELLAEWLTAKRGTRVAVRVPQRGRSVDLVELATRNAKVSHESRFRKSQQDRLQLAASRLGEVLGHEGEVERIDSFDISNIQGSDSVAGMVVFDSGKFDKKQYRIFNIKTVEGADDFRSIAEAVTRRYRRILEEEKEFPDLILIDGGRGQLNAAVTALNRLGIEGTTVAGLAKREEEIYLPDREFPIQLERRDPALQLLQMVRDETHRFSVASHRKRRSKRTLRSELDELAGIGIKRKRLLLEHFGSLSAVRQASPQDLSKVLGRKIGQTVYDQLHATVVSG
ncbi:MAG TPA: excinuclease ABC subunit UvrC [Thermoanaerobaculia bacterium]|nr:excinuclease ABC subunit UvrC [Thermoanaerobaculia bacterium]